MGRSRRRRGQRFFGGLGSKLKESWGIARDGMKNFFSKHGSNMFGGLLGGVQKHATNMVGETADWMRTHGSEALKKQLGFRRGRRGGYRRGRRRRGGRRRRCRRCR